ncbi:hypothetical protein [Elizabethkingia ursingii]|uniref:hypothetical protein n=1 Tax=Elizabethkingia ursingii TaxID=1756150 RepID=UPI000750CD39|nr:hypothetical protein [Elizabethkingia ursingii]KUY29392.1 hypothetical protein ATB96_18930 [Elizabethkingia ursingii]
MDPKEIIQAGTSGVRNSSTLMAEYKRQFKEQFGYEPECPTCGSTKDWNLFHAFANGQTSENTKIMSGKTFLLKNNNIIYSYDVYNEELKRSIRNRSYGNKMTEEFAENYLTHGTEEEIIQRKNQFRILPEKFIELEEEETSGDVVDLSKFTKEKLKQLATEQEFPKEEWQSLKKDELVTYISSKLIEKE